MTKQRETILTLQVIIRAIKSLLQTVSKKLRRNGSDLGLGRKKRRKKHVQHDDP